MLKKSSLAQSAGEKLFAAIDDLAGGALEVPPPSPSDRLIGVAFAMRANVRLANAAQRGAFERVVRDFAQQRGFTVDWATCERIAHIDAGALSLPDALAATFVTPLRRDHWHAGDVAGEHRTESTKAA